MAHTTTRPLGWLLHRITEHDVQRDPDLRYRAFTGNTSRGGVFERVDVTDDVEALNLPARNGRGHWTPPLVRLRGDHVELTTAGQEIYARETRKLGVKNTWAQGRKTRQAAAVPVFQAA